MVIGFIFAVSISMITRQREKKSNDTWMIKVVEILVMCLAPKKTTWLTTFFIVVGINALAAGGTVATCESFYLGEGTSLAAEIRTVELEDGIQLNYHQTTEKNTYRVKRDLPNLTDALLIHMSPNGHTMIWYRNQLIDSNGTPMIAVTRDNRVSHGLTAGIVIAIRDLPKGFDELFQQFFVTSTAQTSLTCVSSACSALRQLGLDNLAPKKFISASGFFRHLIRLTANSQNRIELWSLGADLGNFGSGLRTSQQSFIVSNAFAVLILGVLPGVQVTERLGK